MRRMMRRRLLGETCSRKHRTVLVLTTLALLALQPANSEEERIRVAVMTFDTYLLETNWDFAWDPTRLGPLATSLLTHELARQHRFEIIERRYIEEVMKEQDFGAGGRVDSTTAARIGQLLGAQVVVVGDISNFAVVKKQGKWGRIVGAGKRALHVELDARLVDATTGVVLDSASGEGEVKEGGFDLLTPRGTVSAGSRFDEGQASSALRGAIADLATNIVERSANVKPTPLLLCLEGQVVDVDGSRIYLHLGADTSIKKDDYFEIREAEKPIEVDGEIIGYRESTLGLVRVVEVQERMSIAEVVRGTGFARGNTAKISGGPEQPDLQCVNPRYMEVPVAVVAVGAREASTSTTAGSGTDEVIREEQAPADRRTTISGNLPASDEGPEVVDISTAGRAPVHDITSPIGEWRLDVNETIQHWFRTMQKRAGVLYMPGAREAFEDYQKEHKDEIAEWRQNLRQLHMRLSILQDGTFHMEMRDPADRGLTTVDGHWGEEGLFVVLSGERVDGIDTEYPRKNYLQLIEGRLTAQEREVEEPGGRPVVYLPWSQGFRWPQISGAVYARDLTAQR